MDYQTLSNYCHWNKPKKIKDLLAKQPETINIFYNEGSLLVATMANNLSETLLELLNYYENTFLKGDKYSYEYMYRKKQLQEAIEKAIDEISHDISPEINAIIQKYLPEQISDRDSTNEEDFVTDFHDIEEGAKEEDFSQDLSLEELHNNLEEEANTTHLIGEQIHSEVN